jgi:hypothetical protein
MRGNLDFFLKAQSEGSVAERDEPSLQPTQDAAEECA